MPRSSAKPRRAEPRAPRRSPAPDERQRDGERTRQRILDAAVEEFSAKGYAGARVAEIARRAGVNAQLIAYYFDGKQGLYDTLRERWESDEAIFTGPGQPFAILIRGYLNAVCDQPSRARLLIWQALGDGSEPQHANAAQSADLAEAVADIRRRQETGELSNEYDAETILVILWSAIMAPITMPQTVQHACGADLNSPEFRERYAAQLQRLFAGPATRREASDRPG